MLCKFFKANKIAVITFFAILAVLFFVYLCGSASEKQQGKSEKAALYSLTSDAILSKV